MITAAKILTKALTLINKLKQKTEAFKKSKVIENKAKFVRYVPYSKDLKLHNGVNDLSLVDEINSSSRIIGKLFKKICIENTKQTPQSLIRIK